MIRSQYQAKKDCYIVDQARVRTIRFGTVTMLGLITFWVWLRFGDLTARKEFEKLN